MAPRTAREPSLLALVRSARHTHPCPTYKPKFRSTRSTVYTPGCALRTALTSNLGLSVGDCICMPFPPATRAVPTSRPSRHVLPPTYRTWSIHYPSISDQSPSQVLRSQQSHFHSTNLSATPLCIQLEPRATRVFTGVALTESVAGCSGGGQVFLKCLSQPACDACRWSP